MTRTTTKATTKPKRRNPHLGGDVMEYFRRKEEADPEFAAGVEDLGQLYDLARLVRSSREAAGLSQAELAARMGTKQPAIARLEHAQAWPKIPVLQKLARALGLMVKIELVPRPRKRRRKVKAASERAGARAEARATAR